MSKKWIKIIIKLLLHKRFVLTERTIKGAEKSVEVFRIEV